MRQTTQLPKKRPLSHSFLVPTWMSSVLDQHNVSMVDETLLDINRLKRYFTTRDLEAYKRVNEPNNRLFIMKNLFGIQHELDSSFDDNFGNAVPTDHLTDLSIDLLGPKAAYESLYGQNTLFSAYAYPIPMNSSGHGPMDICSVITGESVDEVREDNNLLLTGNQDYSPTHAIGLFMQAYYDDKADPSPEFDEQDFSRKQSVFSRKDRQDSPYNRFKWGKDHYLRYLDLLYNEGYPIEVLARDGLLDHILSPQSNIHTIL